MQKTQIMSTTYNVYIVYIVQNAQTKSRPNEWTALRWKVIKKEVTG